MAKVIKSKLQRAIDRDLERRKSPATLRAAYEHLHKRVIRCVAPSVEDYNDGPRRIYNPDRNVYREHALPKVSVDQVAEAMQRAAERPNYGAGVDLPDKHELIAWTQGSEKYQSPREEKWIGRWLIKKRHSRNYYRVFNPRLGYYETQISVPPCPCTPADMVAIDALLEAGGPHAVKGEQLAKGCAKGGYELAGTRRVRRRRRRK